LPALLPQIVGSATAEPHAVFSSPFVLILQHFRKKNSLNDGEKADML
jgi:hypothetical protein